MARHEDKARQDMAILDELIKYFQSETSVIDHQYFLNTRTLPGSTYVSCIRVGGVPILPPLVSALGQLAVNSGIVNGDGARIH